MPEAIQNPIVIFDGACGLCNRLVTLALRNDLRGELIFTPNRSEFGTNLCERLGILAESDRTIIVITEAGILMRSAAVIFIAGHLCWPYKCLQWLRIIPSPIRDLGYRCVATLRRLVPKDHDACELLPPELQRRIILNSAVNADENSADTEKREGF
jgi:predicted DCC family thiol-disulfide oxidoreductase YuxK